MNTIVTRMDANNEIFKRVLDDQDFRTLLADYYVKKVYEQLREPPLVQQAEPPNT